MIIVFYLGIFTPITVTFIIIAAVLGILCPLTRWVLYLIRKESQNEIDGLCMKSSYSGLSVGFGICFVAYPFIKHFCPDCVEDFYSGSQNNPLVIFLTGIGYMIFGIANALRSFKFIK